MNPGAGTGAAPQGAESDAEVVARLLGRDPGGAFTVAVRGVDGRPMVITNEPFLRDGTPMPTRYWLVDPELRVLVGRLEAAGGVREADLEVDGTALAETHRRYAAERDALDSRWLGRTSSEWRSGGYPPGSQVSARPPGLVVGWRGRRGRGVGGGPPAPDPPGNLSPSAL